MIKVMLIGGVASWLCDEGSKKSREKEAWTCESKEDADLDEEMRGQGHCW